MSLRASCCDKHPRYQAGCVSCQAVSRFYRRQRLAEMCDGTWRPGYVVGAELDRVRGHVVGLMGVPGISAERVASVAGVSLNAVADLYRGSTPKVTRLVAESVLGVGVEACMRFLAPTTPVDITGSRRRLQSMAVDAWGSRETADLTGIHPSAVRRHRGSRGRGTITYALAQKYRDLYEKIYSQADPMGPSRVTRDRAIRLGYVPAECWADGDIDDPDAEPLPLLPESDDWVAVTQQIERVLHGQQRGAGAHLERELKREVARQAVGRLGWPYERVAEVLGYKSTGAVEYLLNGRRDRPHTVRKGVS